MTRQPPSTRPTAMRVGRAMAGFSLIELMIVVAIIAILAAIAIPSYQDSVWKGKRGEAKAAILRTLQAQERWYTQNNTYQPYIHGGAPAGMPNFSGNNTDADRYRMSVESAPLGPSCGENDARKCVRVTATVIGNPDPRCGSFIAMDTMGRKLSAVANNACWN